MSEAIETPTQGAPAENDAKEQRTFTQEEFEAELGKRVFRERNKYADYEELKAKAAKFDEAEEASKSELQKALERAEKAEGMLKQMEDERKLAELRAEVAKEQGVSADVLRGSTKEELEAHAEQIKSLIGNSQRFPSVPDYGEAKAPAGKKSTASLFAEAVNAK